MKNRKMTTLIAVIAIALFSLVAFIVGVLGLLTIARRDQVLGDFAPPEVIVTNPSAGSSHPAGLVVEVSASALGFQPITRVELWLDGELKESRTSKQPSGITPFNVNYGLLIPEGPHNIVVRAVNSKGVVGQSIPFNIFGTPTDKNAIPSFIFPAKEGETLEDLGKKTGLDPKDILAANPALAGGVPPGGANIIVPVPAEGNKMGVKPNAPPQNQPAPNPKPGSTELKVSIIPGFGFLVENPPIAPDNLIAQIESCWVKLQWRDNSTNETGYRVWRSNPGSLPTKIVNLQKSQGTGAVKAQFAVPYRGIFNIWVEAINQGGVQPSNVVTVNATGCPEYNPERVQIDTLEMRTSQPYEKTYCYISIEQYPATRLPLDTETFNEIIWGKLVIWPQKFNIAVPADQLLDISGECWGWVGANLSKIGVFKESFASGVWDGRISTLEGGGFQIDISILHLGINKISAPATGLSNQASNKSFLSSNSQYPFPIDPSLPVPFNIHQERYGSEDSNASAASQYEWFWERTLKWEWSGDQKEIKGFAIYLDGSFYTWIEGADKRETQVKLPTTCGKNVHWQVAALSNNEQSGLSKPINELLPKCNTYVKVIFDRIEVSCTADGWSPPCRDKWAVKDTLQLYYILKVGSLTKQFYGGNFFFPLTTGTYTFSDLGKMYVTANKIPSADTFIIPINSDPNFDIGVELWDYDDDSGNDKIFSDLRHFTAWTDDDFIVTPQQDYPDCKYKFEWKDSNEHAEIKLYFSYEIFPNSCRDTP
jgi:hypothetical protein